MAWEGFLQNSKVLWYHPCDSAADGQSVSWVPGPYWTTALNYTAGGKVSNYTVSSTGGFAAITDGDAGSYGNWDSADSITVAFWCYNVYSSGLGLGFSTGSGANNGSLQWLNFRGNYGGDIHWYFGTGGPATYSGLATMSANNWHLVVLDLRAPSGGKYTELRQSLDGGAWALHSPTNFYVPSGSPAGTVLRCDSISRLDEAVVWKDADLFTTDELANLHDLADAFGLGMDQYGEQYEAPICWQATAVMPDGTVWRDAGCGPCPAVIRVPRGAADVVVTDEGRIANPRIIEG